MREQALMFRPVFSAVAIALALVSCAQKTPLTLEPAKTAVVSDAAPASDAVKTADVSAPGQRYFQTPLVQGDEQAKASLDLGKSEKLIFKSSAPLSLSVDGMPLPAFINEVFGNLLGVSFEIDPGLQQLTNLVTLRLSKPESPEAVFGIARDVLARYGVDVVRAGEVFRFVPSRGKTGGEPPLIVSGTTLPNVPVSHRDVFLIYTLTTVGVEDAARWLGDIFEGQGLDIKRDPARVSVWLKGKSTVVAQAGEVLQMLDKPAMRGRHSVRVEPLFVDVDRLAKSLGDVLVAQGYAVAGALPNSSGPVLLLPLKELNSLLIFSNDEKVLGYVQSWVDELDRPGKRADGGQGLFRYQVRNTSAKGLSEVLEKAIGESASSDAPSPATSTASRGPGAGAAATDASRNNSSRSGSSLVVDEARNALIFRGTADAWQQLLPVIREMDTVPRQVLVEVLVAEVQLSDAYNFGIEWAINSAALGESLFIIDKPKSSTSITTSTGQTSTTVTDPQPKDIGNGVRIGAAGLSYYPISNSGQTRAVLNLFAEDGRVVIHQTPRIMVKSGDSASINVGTEVPVLTSQSNVPGQQQNGTSALVQQIQYRSTGVSLNVTPVVYEGGRVDLTIEQTLSESTATNSLTPTILNRAVKTSLSVNDGGSVLLGGLITNNSSGGETKVPLLGDIPLIGELFKSRKRSNTRTELMVLIVPYVINDGTDAERLTRSFREKLELMVEQAPQSGDNAPAAGN